MTTQGTVARRPGRSPRLVTKLLALVIALAFAGALAEAMVRVSHPGFPGFRLPQVEHRPIAGLGFEMVPNQDAYTWASPARINSQGFRGPEPRNPPGRPLVLCVGDSMTFGNSVEESETFTYQLQQLMQRQWPEMRPETRNMGVQRYFTYQELELIKRYAPRLKPEIVTLSVYVNDLGLRPTGDYVKEYEDERERAATAFHNAFPMLYLLAKNSATIETMKNIYLGSSGGRTIGMRALDGDVRPNDEPKWRTIEEDLTAFRMLADTYGFRPLVVFVPARRQVTRDMPRSVYPSRLVAHAEKQGLATVSPIAAFKRELGAGHDPYLPWDDHMSAVGHRLVAEAILEQLRQNAHETDAAVAPAGRQVAQQQVQQ
jgi:lysophospholipase L1-like esterase